MISTIIRTAAALLVLAVVAATSALSQTVEPDCALLLHETIQCSGTPGEGSAVLSLPPEAPDPAWIVGSTIIVQNATPQSSGLHGLAVDRDNLFVDNTSPQFPASENCVNGPYTCNKKLIPLNLMDVSRGRMQPMQVPPTGAVPVAKTEHLIFAPNCADGLPQQLLVKVCWRKGPSSGDQVIGSSPGTQLTTGFYGSTFLDRSYSLVSGSTVTKIGFYASNGGSPISATMKIGRLSTAGTYEVVASFAVTHPGTGWADFDLPTPYVVGSGTYRVGAYVGSNSSVNYSSSQARAYKIGDITGTASGFSEDTSVMFATRATYQ